VKHLRAIILLPGAVTVVIPGIILWRTGMDSWDLWQSVPATRVILPVVGVMSICLGLVLMTATILLFAKVGKGTLARGSRLRGSWSGAFIATSAIR
jgi:hypothetical protein